jgi:hypothetical protein
LKIFFWKLINEYEGTYIYMQIIQKKIKPSHGIYFTCTSQKTRRQSYTATVGTTNMISIIFNRATGAWRWPLNPHLVPWSRISRSYTSSSPSHLHGGSGTAFTLLPRLIKFLQKYLKCLSLKL